MENNVSRINGWNVAANYAKQQEAKEDLTQNQSENKNETTEQKQANPNEVLNFIGGYNAALVKPAEKKSVNVTEMLAKYITPESEASIAESMGLLAAKVDTITNVAMDEFGIEEKFATDIALATVNATM